MEVYVDRRVGWSRSYGRQLRIINAVEFLIPVGQKVLLLNLYKSLMFMFMYVHIHFILYYNTRYFL